MKCPYCDKDENRKHRHLILRTIGKLDKEIKRIRLCGWCEKPFVTIETVQE